jgi:hypothetical protein
VTFPSGDPFRDLAPVIARHGLSVDNAADGALVYFETFRELGTPDWRDPTPAQIQVARRQIAGAMARDPFFKTMRGADLQAASDELWLTAAMLAHSNSSVRTLSARQIRESRERIASTVEKVFGFSTETLRLTDQGYVK